MHYTTSDGRQVLDGTAGLWCVNAGHCRPKIVEAIAEQAAELDYAPAFQMGHPKAFELANALVADRARGPQPRPLHQFRLGIGRDGAEGGAGLSPGEGRRQPLPPDRPRARLSRRQFRRHLGRRHRHQPQDVRHAADRRRPHAAHPYTRARTSSPAASPRRAPISPTNSSASSRCTTPRPSRR